MSILVRTNMVFPGTTVARKKVTMTIDAKVFSAFKDVCKRNAMKVSSKVELMMQEFLEEDT